MNVPASGLHSNIQGRIADLGKVDILIGIPSFENEDTVGGVIEKVTRGVHQHFPDKDAMVMLTDGNSRDDTRDQARQVTIPEGVKRVVTTYRGVSGKGSAFRAVFEAGSMMDVDACLVVDADLRTEVDRWVKLHLTPIFQEDMDLMTPSYARHKFDGTITNNVCFPMTGALYGTEVRQPIGGDFGLSGDLVKYYAEQNDWDTDVARFGIDIWMTTTAINEGFSIGQTNLGAKIHDPKDPGEALGPMFKQVVGTLFRMMKWYAKNWYSSDQVNTAPTFGPPLRIKPEPVPVDREGLRRRALAGWQLHKEDYQRYLSDAQFELLSEQFSNEGGEIWRGRITANQWARILYDYSVSYNFETSDPDEMIATLIPLYFARTACLFDEMEGKQEEEAEAHIQSLVDVMLEEKSHLKDIWPEDLS